jgi:hypothetical protein
VDIPSNKIYTGEVYGKLRIAYDEFSIPDPAVQLGAADIVRLCEIPKGARLHEVIFSHDDFQTNGSVSIGWEDSEDLDSDGNPVEAEDLVGLLPTTLITAAGVSRMTDASAAGINKKFDAKVRLTADVVAATTDAAAGNTFKVTVIYSVE